MILVTGGYGCIGAELIKWLLRNTDHNVLLGSRRVSDERTARTFHDVDCERLTCITLDVSDAAQVTSAFSSYSITHVAHLGALQTPDCNANRDLGMQINLGGTQRLAEAAKSAEKKLERFVFASSIAVYGPRASYDVQRVPMLSEPNPVNVYGVWKLASEHVLKLFREDTGVPTVCIRPGVLFGPGRDLGLTSTPTMAMKCVARGEPFEIPFKSKQDYLYAPDVGAAFGISLTAPFDGFGTYTLLAQTLTMKDVVAAIRTAAVEVDMAEQCNISHGQDEVPFICELEYEPVLRTFPQIPLTGFKDAVAESLSTFKMHIERGWL